MRETITEKERLILVWEWPKAISRVLLNPSLLFENSKNYKIFCKILTSKQHFTKVSKVWCYEECREIKIKTQPTQKWWTIFRDLWKIFHYLLFIPIVFFFYFAMTKDSYETVKAGFTSLTLDWCLNGFYVRMVSGSPAVVTGVTLSTVPI